MGQAWTIGGSPRRPQTAACFNAECGSCDVRSGCCTIHCEVCGDRVAAGDVTGPTSILPSERLARKYRKSAGEGGAE